MNKQQLAVKDFLMGANCIDACIRSKMEQIQFLNDMASRASAIMSDMPGSPNRNIHKMEDTICKIIDLQTEIEADMNSLIRRKRQIVYCINQVDDMEARMVLEERYLRKTKWEDIALYASRSRRQIFRIHDDALKKIKIPESWH